jgi:hypothetical protein
MEFKASIFLIFQIWNKSSKRKCKIVSFRNGNGNDGQNGPDFPEVCQNNSLKKFTLVIPIQVSKNDQIIIPATR